MYEKQSKNLLILNILKILREETDSEHTLSQEDIKDILSNEYDMDIDRKTIKRNLENLKADGYEINNKTITRGKGKNKNEVTTDYYIESEFDDSELRLLIDGLIFSKYIPYNQRKELIDKLTGLKSKYFNPRIEFIQTVKDDVKINKEIFYNIAIIDEAIRERKKIKFNYCSYDIKKSLKPRLDKNTGKVKEYIVSPFYIAAALGRYYLICKFENHDGTSNIRIDRIVNIKKLEDPIESNISKPNLPKHMCEHLYMMGGESGLVSFDFNEKILNDVVDWFGSDIIFIKKDNGVINAQVTVNFDSMKFWALQYGENVKVLSPKSLVNNIKKVVDDMRKKYK